MTANPVIERYAIRRVNPFLGVLQVITTPDGRASSANGLTWDIQVIADMPPEWGSLSQSDNNKAFYRYGLWSENTGLVHRPLAVQNSTNELSFKSSRIIERIQENLSKLPFDIKDNKELWLLDADENKPLALLATLTLDEKLPSPEPRYWESCLGQNGVPSQLRFPDSDLLVSQVKRRAGFNIKKRWFIRDSQGEYLTNDSGTQLSADEFPGFMLREDWSDAQEQQRVKNYIHWTAPALLTLQNLRDDQRNRLEINMTQQAISIEHHWRLYPKVLDQKKLNRCRIQAQLQANTKPNDS